jgi:hypothetical protein
MIETCIHCHAKQNTHQVLSMTCTACGRPMHKEVQVIGTLAQGAGNFYDVFVGRMACFSRAVQINGSPLMLGAAHVYVDAKQELYIILKA